MYYILIQKIQVYKKEEKQLRSIRMRSCLYEQCLNERRSQELSRAALAATACCIDVGVH